MIIGPGKKTSQIYIKLNHIGKKRVKNNFNFTGILVVVVVSHTLIDSRKIKFWWQLWPPLFIFFFLVVTIIIIIIINTIVVGVLSINSNEWHLIYLIQSIETKQNQKKEIETYESIWHCCLATFMIYCHHW